MSMNESPGSLDTFRLLNDLPAEQQVGLLRSLIDVIPEAVIAHGPDGDLAFWSNGMCALLGYTREEIARLKPYGWVDRSAIRGAPGRLESILHDGALTFESRAVRKDGTTFPTLVTARRIDTHAGPLVVSVIRDVSSLKTAQEQLSFLANHDALTSAFNRTTFDERLSIALLDARRHGDSVAVICFDIDGFRLVNERLGHTGGDTVLATTAQRLASALREQDLVARLGSDAFAVLMTRVRSADELGTLADRLLDAVAEPMSACGSDVCVTASCGIAVCDIDNDDCRTLVLKADIAMYAAKHDPDTRWRIWTDSLGAPPPSGA